MLAVSVIIPTYNEAKNLPFLIEEIVSVVDKNRINLEFIVVDDNSPDGTGAIVEELASKYPIKVIHRSGKMGLGSAVVEGFKASNRPFIGVMDADLSHDPSILNNLILSLEHHDIAVGSRFSEGSMVENWQWWRKLISNVGVFFARQLTKIKDPLSGYFFLRRQVIENVNLKTKGYKILLEILVKGKYNRAQEIPLTFRMRKFSASKLNYIEYLLFFGQLLKYAAYTFYKFIKMDKDRLNFLIPIVISGFLLFYRVSARSFWMDEAAVLEYLYHTPNPLNFIVDYFRVPDNHPPLYYFLVISLYKIFPLGELGIRLLSVLSGLGIVIVVYYLSLLLFKDKAMARTAMFFTTISSYFILISQMARYHSLAALLTLGSLYYFCKIFLQGYARQDLIRFLILAILVAYTDLPHFIYLVVTTNLFYFYKKLRKSTIIEFKKWVGGQIVLLILFLPIVYMFYLRVFNQGDGGFEKTSLLGKSFLDWASDFLMHFYAYFFGENILPWNWLPFMIGMFSMLLLLFILIKGIYNKNWPKEIHLLLYFSFSLIIANTIFLNYADPRYNFIVYPKYVFAAFPLFIMLMTFLIRQIKNKISRYCIFITILVVACSGLFNFYNRKNYLNGSYFNDFKSYKFVQDNAQTGDYLIINGDANVGLYNFYKNKYFKNLTPVSVSDLSLKHFKNKSRFWFFSTGLDGDSVYGSAAAEDKIPEGFVVVGKFQSVPIDKKLLRLKQKITGRQSYEYKYGVYLLKYK